MEKTSGNKASANPVNSPKALQKQGKKDRLSTALRDNLRRRKSGVAGNGKTGENGEK